MRYPKIFLKAPLAPIYTNIEGEGGGGRGGARVEKKTRFFDQLFSKNAKNAVLACFFQNFACGAGNLAKARSFHCFGKARKINLVDLKKVDKNFENFLKIPPSLRDNPRSDLTTIIVLKTYYD